MDSMIPIKRNFGGKLSGFTDNKDRHFNQRMLKAYLRGDSQFIFGKSYKPNNLGFTELLPDHYPVLTTGNEVNEKDLEALLIGGNTKSGSVFNRNGRTSAKERKAMIKVRLKIKLESLKSK